jgi:hypothetical protein
MLLPTITAARMVVAWHSQRPNLSVSEKRLFDEHYKTIFRTGYDPASVLALQTWLNAIEEARPDLALNDVLKGRKILRQIHILFRSVRDNRQREQTAHNGR